MGVYIDYSFHAECPEEELLARLRRLRQRVSRLPLRWVKWASLRLKVWPA